MQVLSGRTVQDDSGANVQSSRFEQLALKIRRPATTQANCERSHLVEQLLAGVGERATFKQLTGQLRRFTVPELHALLKTCRGARNFGSMFWHIVKKRRAVDKSLDARRKAG